MKTEYDYSVVRPVVDKSKLRELAYMIRGEVPSTIRKPTLYLRKIGTNYDNGNSNIQNVYGNDVAAWKTLGASYNSPSAGAIAAKRRRERETTIKLRELGKLVRGQIHYYD